MRIFLTLLWMTALLGTARAGVDQLLALAAEDAGYTSLFADDLSNALFSENLWSFEGGVLRPTPDSSANGAEIPKHARDIWSVARYGDFIVDLEFKCAEDTNSGVFLRCDDVELWLHTSIEAQIHQVEQKTDRHEVGAVFDCKAPDVKPVLNPVGEWNHYTVIAKGQTLRVVLNGALINTVNLDLWTEAGKNPDGTKNKFKTAYKDMPREGHIGLQYHGQPVWFRNVRIKTL